MYLFSEPKIVKNKESHQNHLNMTAILEDQKWNQTNIIDIELVKKNLTQLYQSRNLLIQEICQNQTNNKLLEDSNKLHGY